MQEGILDPQRRRLVSRLGFLKSRGFYLAGGTALALQIGHRTSADFDFYTPEPLDPTLFWAFLKKELPSAENLRMAEGTLIALVEGAIEMSFFQYEYPLLKPLVAFPPIDLASREDIAAMKVVAISQRGIRRDFIDLYFLSRELDLFNVIRAALEKYQGLNVYTIFQSLCYFEDAEGGPERPYRLLQPVEWEEVKRFFEREVRRVQKLF